MQFCVGIFPRREGVKLNRKRLHKDLPSAASQFEVRSEFASNSGESAAAYCSAENNRKRNASISSISLPALVIHSRVGILSS